MFRFLLFCFSSILILTTPARADWINLSGAETSPNIAEIYVQDDRIKLVLEIYIGDLNIFDDLVPDDWLKNGDMKRPSKEDRLNHFSQNSFRLITETGENLQAEVKLVEPRMRQDRQSPFAGMINPSTRQRVPEPPADKRVLYVELIYPFQHKPKQLTIIPPLDDEGRVRATIGFITYHKSVPVIDFRYLGLPAHLNLNWEDPWYTKFENPNLSRHHKSALMSYLYVEPYEVRHEILTRVKDLEQWMDTGLKGKQYIEVDELEALKRRIGEFFLTKNPLRIDGKLAKPILDGTNFVKVSLQGIQLIEQPVRLEVSTAIVGVILAYMTNGMPQQVTVDWELFNDSLSKVPATATDPAGPLPSFVTPDDFVLTWTNYLKNYKLPKVKEIIVSETLMTKRLPIISFLCILILMPLAWYIHRRIKTHRPVGVFMWMAGVFIFTGMVSFNSVKYDVPVPVEMTAGLNEEQGKILLTSLLKNVYRAFDFREEEDVYDKLALSASGEILAEIYLQNRQSFAVKQAGGAQAKVKQVDVLDIQTSQLEDRPLSYSFKTRWTAMGTVGHLGHVHVRKNLYDAVITVKAVDKVWKITGLELLEEQRIDPFGKSGNAI